MGIRRIYINVYYTLFSKRHEGKITILIIYVNDMIMTINDTKEIENLKKYLASEFNMKNLEGLKHSLGIEVTRSKQSIFFYLKRYMGLTPVNSNPLMKVNRSNLKKKN